MKDLADRKHRYDKAYRVLFPKSRSWRLRFFNWLTQGRITIEEENQVSSNAYQSPYGQLQTIPMPSANSNLPGITFKITAANGGTIITVKKESSQYVTLGGINSEDELYIIPDDAEDFDRELGKIITMYRLKK